VLLGKAVFDFVVVAFAGDENVFFQRKAGWRIERPRRQRDAMPMVGALVGAPEQR